MHNASSYGGLVDTHRHLGGSCPIDFVMHAMQSGACQTLTREEVERRMVCLDDEPREFKLFLHKFKFLDRIKWTRELIADKIKFICDEMANENLSGVFLDFSVSKYRHIGWPLKEAIQFILDSLDFYSRIPVAPILSIKYESPPAVQLKIARCIEDSDIADRICGIDFVGEESKLNRRLQKQICDMWRGKMIRMHVGESQPSKHIMAAIKTIGVTNVAHGIRVIDDPELMKMSADSGVSFDIAPTSNYMTGVIPGDAAHPAKMMYDAGIQLTVGADDPTVLRTNLHNEYDLLARHGMSEDDLRTIASNGRYQLLEWMGPLRNAAIAHF